MSSIEHALILVLVALGALTAFASLGERVSLGVECAALALGGAGASCGASANTSAASASAASARGALAASRKDALGASREDAREGSRAGSLSGAGATPRARPVAPDGSEPASSSDDSIAHSVASGLSSLGSWLGDHVAQPVGRGLTALVDFDKGLAEGVWDGGKSLVVGTAQLAWGAARWTWDHGLAPFDFRPDRTSRLWDTLTGFASGAFRAITNPLDTWHAATSVAGAIASHVWHGILGAWDTLLHGTAEERGHLIGRVGFDVATLVIPATKIGKVGEAAEMASNAARLAAAEREALVAIDLVAPAEPRAVAALLDLYRARVPLIAPEGERLAFAGVEGFDVYNPTRPFQIGGRTVLAARVESRASETDSTIRFFEESAGTWRVVPGSPELALQDPFVTELGDEIVLGGAQVEALAEGGTRYRTMLYRGSDVGALEPFATGPWGMKGIRLAQLEDGRIFVLTRPQGAIGGRGQIGYTVVDSLDALTPRAIERARIIERQFLDTEWGGANEIVVLGPNRVGVLGHIARFGDDAARAGAPAERHYYPMAFEIDLRTGRVSDAQLLLERGDLPGGLAGASKRSDLRDVLYSGGLVRHGDGRATLYVGAGDAESYRVHIADPFYRRH